MRGIQALAAAAACAGLGGCASPTLTLGTEGPVRTSVETGVVKTFYDAVSSARTSPSDENAQKMLLQGFRLVYANCDEFFNTAGKHQQWIFVARDVVGAIGTIGTSVLALHDGSKMAVSNLALATGVTYSGLDIYTKNFLFSAENIAAVRELITKALEQHENGVMALAPFSYETATMHILDKICLPNGHDVREISQISHIARNHTRFIPAVGRRKGVLQTFPSGTGRPVAQAQLCPKTLNF